MKSEIQSGIRLNRTLACLIGVQVCLNGCMAGVRMAEAPSPARGVDRTAPPGPAGPAERVEGALQPTAFQLPTS